MGGYVVYAMWLLVCYMRCACCGTLCTRRCAYCGTLSAICHVVQHVLCDVPNVAPYLLYAMSSTYLPIVPRKQLLPEAHGGGALLRAAATCPLDRTIDLRSSHEGRGIEKQFVYRHKNVSVIVNSCVLQYTTYFTHP